MRLLLDLRRARIGLAFSLAVTFLDGCGATVTAGGGDAQTTDDRSMATDAAAHDTSTDTSSDLNAPSDADAGNPVDAPSTEAAAGDGGLGTPCQSNDQCQGKLCLGGMFEGGYCSSPVAECDPGNTCDDGGACDKSSAVEVDGGPAPEFCLVACTGPADCRTGYACCLGATYSALTMMRVCVPPSLCPD